jgi:hypothetical protein
VDGGNINLRRVIEGVAQILIVIVVVLIGFFVIGTILVPDVVGGDFSDRPWLGDLGSSPSDPFSAQLLNMTRLAAVPTVHLFLGLGIRRLEPISMRWFLTE